MATSALAGASAPPEAFPSGTAAERASIATPTPQRWRGPDTLAAGRFLPVIPALAGLFPGGGLSRGGTILLGPASATPGRAPGLTSLLLLLLAGTSAGGYWCAVVGLPELGLAAASELGADLDRLILVPDPGSEGRWQSVAATLLETVELVCLAPASPVRATDARRLSARARERGSTLVVFDAACATAAGQIFSGDKPRVRRTTARWPGPCDLCCSVRESSWSGLGHGHGRLRSLQIEAEVGGRGAASRPRRSGLRLPA